MKTGESFDLCIAQVVGLDLVALQLDAALLVDVPFQDGGFRFIATLPRYRSSIHKRDIPA